MISRAEPLENDISWFMCEENITFKSYVNMLQCSNIIIRVHMVMVGGGFATGFLLRRWWWWCVWVLLQLRLIKTNLWNNTATVAAAVCHSKWMNLCGVVLSRLTINDSALVAANIYSLRKQQCNHNYLKELENCFIGWGTKQVTIESYIYMCRCIVLCVFISV